MKCREHVSGVKGFTLIEVIIAIGILAISLASLFQIIASSRARIAKADEGWHHMHMLTQAAEYVLLHDSTVDDEQIDEEFMSIDGQLPLELCTIELRSLKSTGKDTVGILEIERIIYDDEGFEPE